MFVEAESRKIGRLHVPDALIGRIRGGECIRIDATLAARVAFLIGDYDYFLTMSDLLNERLAMLGSLHSAETMKRWRAMIAAADWSALVRELLEQHYDPLYCRSQARNFSGYGAPNDAPAAGGSACLPTDDLSATGIAAIAARIAHSRTAQIA